MATIENSTKPLALNTKSLPNLGYGIGLRPDHIPQLLQLRPQQLYEGQTSPDWLEIISENYLDDHGLARHQLHQLRTNFPLVFHGVSLSIGSNDPLNFKYLMKLRQLADEFEPAWISDHLCWTGVGGINSHDLLPIPLNQQNLAHVIARVQQAQDFLARPLLLENPSSYMHFKESEMTEWEFLNTLCEVSGAGILLDLNNIYVSAFNLGFEASHYLRGIQKHHVKQVHLAGPRHCGTHIIDTHDSPVVDEVWGLYRELLMETGEMTTLLEWDAQIPPLKDTLNELNKARGIAQERLLQTGDTHFQLSACQPKQASQ